MSISATPRGGAFTARGQWDAKTPFYQDDVCLWQGTEWRSLLPYNLGNQPDLSPFAWSPDTSVMLSVADAYGRVAVAFEPPPSVMDPKWGAKGDGSTIDTTAINNAMTDVSTVGINRGAPQPLVFPAGRAFVTGKIIPQSYVDVQAYGARLVRDPAYTTNAQLFHTPNGNPPVSFFKVRGATYTGTGTENTQQGFLFIQNSNDVICEDNVIDTVNAFLIYFKDVTTIRCNKNKITNQTFGQAINFVNSGNGTVTPLKNIWCQENYINKSGGGYGINFVADASSNRTDPILDAHVNHNTVILGNNGPCLGIEQGGTNAPPNVGVFEFLGNTLINTAGGTAFSASNDSTNKSTDPLCIYGVTFGNNRCFISGGPGTGDAVLLSCSHSTATGNHIEAGRHDFQIFGHGGAAMNHLTIADNEGGFGTGDHIDLLSAAAIDPTTCRLEPYSASAANVTARQETSGTAAPTTNTWKVGALCWNTAPTATGTLLWVCTTAGTPGTWTPVTLP